MGGAESKARSRSLRHPSHLADRPSPPGKPQLVPSDNRSPEPDVVTIRWQPPRTDGGSMITGYLVEHRRTGSPHWVRSAPALVKVPELTLSGLEPGWRYQFRVSAQNAAGLSEPGELSDLLTVTLQRTAASAPYFVRELHNTVALENDKAELSVQVRGTPAPTIAWFKDGVEVFSSRSYRVLTDNEVSTLIIYQAALSDEGEIKCSATNRVGYAVSRAKLVIEAPPSIRLPRQYEEGLLFEKDEVIRLKVSVAGRPVPTVSWLLNGEPVPGSGRYEAAHSERYATLRVGEARRSDRGEYQVRAVNRLGEDTASFLVTVADRPMPPGRANVVMTLGRSVTLSWTTPEDDGGCKIGNYIVEYYRLGWNMWLKAATCRQLTTTLGDLIEGSEYKFRVKAENPYGVSEPSQESDVVFIPDPKRGLLEPPEHGPADTEVAMDLWLEEDKKRPKSPSPPVDGRYGERKTKKKRGPTESRGQSEKHSMMSEDSMSPPVTPEVYPIIPKRRAKVDKIKELQEERDLQKKLEERRKVEEFKKFEERRKAEETIKAEEQEKAEEIRKKGERMNLHLRLKKEQQLVSPPSPLSPRVKHDLHGSSEMMLSQQTQQMQLMSPQSPLSPRVKHDLHGSSELMLVLLPHSRATTEERETSKRELFESSMALEEDVAPPMSLSAPELGSGDPPEPPPVRSAFSSTELLHERAMARFYQDMAGEDTEAPLKRRGSLKRRQSFGSRNRDIPEISRSLENVVSSSRSLSDNVGKSIQSSTEKTPLPKSTGLQVFSGRITLSRDSMDSMLSTEDPNRKVLVQQTSEEDMEYEDSSFEEDEEDEYDEGEEEEESIIDEAAEEEFEEEEEEFSIDDKRGPLYTSESEDEIRYSYSLEEDTYHPSPVNVKYNEDTMISAYEGRGPLILGTPARPPPVLKHAQVESDVAQSVNLKPKPILKRASTDKSADKIPEPTQIVITVTPEEEKPKPPPLSPEKRFEPNFSPVMPKPILKVRESSQERLSPVSQRRGVPLSGFEAELSLGSSRTNLDEGSDYESGVKKKQVRIEEPGEKKETEQPVRERKGSVGEDTDATKVLISHYSDIVAEFGRGRKPAIPLYMNYEALKAAAEEEEEQDSTQIPEIVVKEPEPEVEPEPIKPEKPSVHFQPNVEDRLTPEWEPPLEPPRKKSPSPEKKRSVSPRKKKRSPSPMVGKHRVAVQPPQEATTTPPPPKTEPTRTASPARPLSARSARECTSTEKKVHTYFDFLMDFSLFVLACWLYLFKDERLSIPVMCLMIYRQAHEAFQRQMEAFRNRLPRRVLFWRRQ